jgi:aspartate/methionine/tyrosine aminotransferase
MRNGDTHYTATAGTPALRAAICAKLQRENGLIYKPQNVVVGCGAKQFIFEAFAATLNAGDEVIIPAPYWVSYPEMVGLDEGKSVIVTCGKDVDFKLTPAALDAAITKRIEEVFGWMKSIGLLRKVRHRGLERVGWMFTFTAAAYNLVRIRNLMRGAPQPKCA